MVMVHFVRSMERYSFALFFLSSKIHINFAAFSSAQSVFSHHIATVRDKIANVHGSIVGARIFGAPKREKFRSAPVTSLQHPLFRLSYDTCFTSCNRTAAVATSVDLRTLLFLPSHKDSPKPLSFPTARCVCVCAGVWSSRYVLIHCVKYYGCKITWQNFKYNPRVEKWERKNEE